MSAWIKKINGVMVVNCLTMYPFTSWGASYNEFNWSPEWEIFLKMWDHEIRENYKVKNIGHLICWFDKNILQAIGKENMKSQTIHVRLRILCGLVNKLKIRNLTRELKIQMIECMWSMYKQFDRKWEDYYCKMYLKLPF